MSLSFHVSFLNFYFHHDVIWLWNKINFTTLFKISNLRQLSVCRKSHHLDIKSILPSALVILRPTEMVPWGPVP